MRSIRSDILVSIIGSSLLQEASPQFDAIGRGIDDCARSICCDDLAIGL